jgi:gamma-glutamyl hercynylcysteine S-oxide hydrolase
MCRHLAWLGAPRSLQAVVVDRPHALYEQSWVPRRQRHGTVNVDGFGVGWYVDCPRPVRYRRAQPIWTDASFASLAPTIASSCVLAAVRSATPGTAADEGAAAPFTHERWLFSHNGRLHDWAAARKALGPEAADVPDTRVGVDSALLFGLALARWQAGASLPDGLAGAARDVLDHGGGRLTMLATDGTTVAGVVAGEPMHVLTTPDGTLVASEPDDDDPAWRELADLSVVHLTDGALTETSL